MLWLLSMTIPLVLNARYVGFDSADEQPLCDVDVNTIGSTRTGRTARIDATSSRQVQKRRLREELQVYEDPIGGSLEEDMLEVQDMGYENGDGEAVGEGDDTVAPYIAGPGSGANNHAATMQAQSTERIGEEVEAMDDSEEEKQAEAEKRAARTKDRQRSREAGRAQRTIVRYLINLSIIVSSFPVGRPICPPDADGPGRQQ